jgi:molybdenum cofactor synthesis domain-containing protein
MSGIGILVVGNEILDGLVLDTNSQWIINRLKPFNLKIWIKMTVRDEISEIARGIKHLIKEGCNLIFTTGGLGPTHDDKTLEGIAEAFCLPLVINDEALEIVTRQYANLHNRGVVEFPEITAPRRKMACLPKGARPLDNRVGGAPGVLLEGEQVQVVSLPGVPLELKWIFENEVLPMQKKRIKGNFVEDIVHLPLKDETTLAPIIDEAMDKVPGVYVKSLVKPYGELGIRLWVSASGNDKQVTQEKVKRVVNLLKEMTKDRLPEG